MVIRVQTRDNEPVDKALRRLRKLCNNEGITRRVKAKAYFEKPSEQRRREGRERIKAIRLSARAKKRELNKLLQRRRKARKNARLQAMRDSESAQAEGNTVLPADKAAEAPVAENATATPTTTTPAPEPAASSTDAS